MMEEEKETTQTSRQFPKFSESYLSDGLAELQDSINETLNRGELTPQEALKLITHYSVFVMKTVEDLIHEKKNNRPIPGMQSVFVHEQIRAIDNAHWRRDWRTEATKYPNAA